MSHSFAAIALVAAVSLPVSAAPAVTGEHRLWHKLTLTWSGPEASETSPENPFTDYRLDVTFTHKSGSPSHRVPGYFAADGKAAESSAASGNQW